MIIGVLAVQGDFYRHSRKLDTLGIDNLEVRTVEQLSLCDGLILPGGESSTIKKVLDAGGMFIPVREFCRTKPVYGTCAGCIMLAKEVVNDSMETLGIMDISVERNSYGSQVNSFSDTVQMAGKDLEAIFIRAPRIISAGANVDILIKHNGDPVLVRQDTLLASTFHPELTEDSTIHLYFASMVAESAALSTNRAVSS